MSEQKAEITLSIPISLWDFFLPYATAAGISLHDLLVRVLGEKKSNEMRLKTPRGLNAADRGVLMALLLLPDESTPEPPKLSRRELQARTGLAALTVVRVTEALTESGDLISSQALAERGRHGPAPTVYTLTAKGCATAFLTLPATADTSVALDHWERFYGRIDLKAAPLSKGDQLKVEAQAAFERIKAQAAKPQAPQQSAQPATYVHGPEVCTCGAPLDAVGDCSLSCDVPIGEIAGD